MNINFPKEVWDKVMSLSRSEQISPVQVLYMAINFLHSQHKEGQTRDDTRKLLPENNRPE